MQITNISLVFDIILVFFSDHGPDLYGTEPWTYYLFNGFLNFNFVFIAGLLVWPLQGLLHSVANLPPRGTQFLPVGLSQVCTMLQKLSKLKLRLDFVEEN